MTSIKTSYIKPTIAIAGPCIFENLTQTMASFINSIMVGHLGPVATASVGINATIIWVLYGIAGLFSTTALVLISRYIGAEQYDEANNAASQLFGATLIFSCFVTAAVFLSSGAFPVFMNAAPDVIPHAANYLKIFSAGIILNFSAVTASGILRAAGNTKTPMKVGFLRNLLLVFINLFLIYPSRQVNVLGFSFWMPGTNWGVEGAAVSLVLSQIISGIILAYLLLDKRQVVHIDYKKIFKIKKQIINKIIEFGLPAAGEQTSINIGQVFYFRIITDLGTIAVAAHHFAITVESITYMPALGFSIAATTLVGQSLGAKNKDDAVEYAKVSLLLAFIFGVIGGSLFFLFPENFLSLFTDVPEIIKSGTVALKIIAISEPYYLYSFVLIGILRGGGDTKFPFLAALTGMWGIRLFTSWFFAIKLGLGLAGAWIGMAADVFARLIVLYGRYRKRNWLNTEV